MTRGRFVRGSALALSFVVVAIATTTLRALLDGQAELAQSDAAFNKGDLRGALEHARRAATLYAPGASHVSRAYERLFAIALGSEAAHEPHTAFLAWQAARSAALETRHLWLPRAAELERANSNLARLEALGRASDEAGLDPRSSLQARIGAPMRPVDDTGPGPAQAKALARLRADEAPDAVWIATLGAGFLLALAGLWLFALRGVTRDGRFVPRPARLGLALTLIGAACWTFAVYKA